MNNIVTAKILCALCSNEITADNDSKEHIIPNSIGGKKKVKGFICITCNSVFGSKWDVEVANQFNWFSLYLGIKRESGEPKSLAIQTANGKRLALRADQTMTIEHPIVEKSEQGSQTQYKVQARTIEEARKILKGIASKYPNVDIEKTLAEAELSETPLDSPIKMNIWFGGPLFGRSIVKTAFAFASNHSIPHFLCDQATSYLKNSLGEAESPYSLFYMRDLVLNRPTDKLFHCVAIKGDSENRRLVAYIEYFGFARLVVNLSSSYTGNDIFETYALDPTTGEEIDLDIDLNLSDEEMTKVLENCANPLDEYVKALNHAMPIVMSRGFERERNRVISEAN